MSTSTKAPSLAGTLTCAGLLVAPTLILLTQLVVIAPRTKKTCDEFGLTLPWLTQKVLQIGIQVHLYWWLLVPAALLILALVVGGLAWLRHGLRYRALLVTALLMIPLVVTNVIVAYGLVLPLVKLQEGLSK